MLLSIGGNDVGFSALALNAMTESAGDMAPIVSLIGREVRYGTDVARAYLGVLDHRLKAVRDALQDGFGVEPSRVVQTAYEPIHLDETGAACGLRPTLGVDVHPKFKMDYARVQEAGSFLGELSARLECISDAKRRADCPPVLRPAPAPASAWSPSTFQNSPGADCARAIPSGRTSTAP